mgnify:CR=1 FL=1
MTDKQFKPGDKVLVKNTAWYLPYRGKIVVVLRQSKYNNDLWVEGNEEYHEICFHLDEIDLVIEEPIKTSAYDTPTDFKVGDEVYCLLYGAGVVEDISTFEDFYPVRVRLDDCSTCMSYTTSGLYNNDQQRVLFHSKPEVLGGARLKPSTPEYKGQYVGKQVTIISKRDPSHALLAVVDSETSTSICTLDGILFYKADNDIYIVR